MKHLMKLNNGPFLSIKSGKKTIEMRLYDKKRQKLKKGDIIEFTNNESGEILCREVVNLHKYSTFDELYKNFDKVSIGYEENDIAKPSDMSQYYNIDDIKKYGVVGIELKNIKINLQIRFFFML